MLTVNLFDLSHLSTFTNSVFMSFMILLYAVPSINTLVSSAINMENNRSDALEKSFMYKMNSKGPSMDP